MQVILLERVGGLGNIGDVVTVKNGFGRNFLLPKGKALLANASNKRRFEAERSQIEERNQAAKEKAAGEAESLDGVSFVLIRQSSETGQLYGSVTARDVAAAASEAGYPVSRSQVVLNMPLKMIGVHQVEVRLHPEVDTSITVNIARSEGEAERQSAGENVIEAAMEEDRAQADAQAAEMAEAAAEAAAERGPGDDD